VIVVGQHSDFVVIVVVRDPPARSFTDLQREAGGEHSQVWRRRLAAR
jgi:hypothetical protein